MTDKKGIPARTYGALQIQLRESLFTRTLVLPIQEFIHIQGMSSILLLGAAIAALIWANSPWHDSYHHVWELQLTLSSIQLPVHAWINDALMAIFFFLVGMEIKHEIVHGELSDIRKAALPIVGAVGGMVLPALLFVAVNFRGPGQHGWGVPMATDIAFSLGVLGMVKGIPSELKVFLLTLAIADDLGAIGLIAIFFTSHIHAWALVGAAATLVALVGLSEWKDAPFLFRAAGFVVLAAFTLKSGMSTSLAGVAAAFTVPIGPRRPGQEGVLKHFMQSLHPYVAFAVLPLFAFTAAGFSFADMRWSEILTPMPLGIAAGLFIGKQVGVIAAVFILVRTGLARRPTGSSWLELYGVALLCGVGFTLSLFMGDLAFEGQGELARSQMTLGVAVGSIVSALAGMAVLALAGRRREAREKALPG